MIEKEKSFIFNEVFGAYTQIIGAIINKALENNDVQWSEINEISDSLGFKDTNIKDFIRQSDIFAKNKDNHFITVLKHEYHRPISIIEKQWIKTIMQDPRFKLFDINDKILSDFNDVEPLFDINDICYYDQRKNGDDFSDSEYIGNFRIILKAIQNNEKIIVCFESPVRGTIEDVYIPEKFEYSLKEDKIRLKCSTESKKINTFINLSRIKKVEIKQSRRTKKTVVSEQSDKCSCRIRKAVLHVTDEKDIVERILLHFSHLKRETTRADENHYTITLFYDEADEKEMVIRIMSFGPNVKVSKESAQTLILGISEKIKKQQQLFAF